MRRVDEYGASGCGSTSMTDVRCVAFETCVVRLGSNESHLVWSDVLLLESAVSCPLDVRALVFTYRQHWSLHCLERWR